MCKSTTIILLCSAFSLFTTQVSAQNADIDLLRSINGSSSTGLRHYSTFISNTTTVVAFSTPVVMGVVALIEKDDNLLKNAIYVGAAIGVDGLMTYSLKKVVNRDRPYVTYPDIHPAMLETSNSFPSGHTSLAFATATAISLKYPKWYVIAPSYLWACSVGYSRLNLGVHYPTDVLVGALLGAGSAYVTYKINDWFWKKHENKKLIGLQAYL
ncbi:MAG TPA: phosphatase PAP2 family protein [Paludibacter sp.]|nr:phosphatase PAP2 family protein [Paludibacter sp.]